MASEAIARGRVQEDILVQDHLVRHSLWSRRIHWLVALSFFGTLFSGLPIWTPIFGWLAGFFGGLAVCRWLHPWLGTSFFVFAGVMFLHWLADMRLEEKDQEWLSARALTKMREGGTEETGKYNGGQKLFFFAVTLGAVALFASGLVLWFPMGFSAPIRFAAILLHEFTFILFAIAIVLHIYLGTSAEPGTFRSMTRGTVTRGWARHHHPRWYREVTGGDA